MKKSLGPKTILYPCPVMIVGSYDEQGIPNLMSVAWGGICCSDPPCVNISIRPQRHSYEAVLKRKAFTVNIPSASLVREADYVGIYSGKGENKFESLGLTAVKSELVDAPLIEEFPLNLECRVLHKVEIGIHLMFVGEILDVKGNEEVLDENGKFDLDKLAPILYAIEQRAYHAVGAKVADAFSVGKKEGSGG